MAVRYSKHLPHLIFITDLMLLNFAVFLISSISHNFYRQSFNTQFLLLFNLSWVAVSSITRCFIISRPLWLREHFTVFLRSLGYHFILVMVIIYAFRPYLPYLPQLVLSYLLFFFMVAMHRSAVFFFLDVIRKKGYNNRQIIIIGDREISERLMHSFSQHLEYGFDLADFISEDQMMQLPEEILIEKLLNKKPDEIFICYKLLDGELLKRLINVGDEHFIKINVVSDLILSQNYARLINYNDVPVLHLTSNPESGLTIMTVVRAFEILISIAVMTTGAPLFVILYFLTRYTSAGPVFHKEKRVSGNGQQYYSYKFRSMTIDNGHLTPQGSRSADLHPTKLGNLMRKTRLDQLPQFWNVLKGDISMISPRPIRQSNIERMMQKKTDITIIGSNI